jgi:hypothetical protein
MSTEQTYSLFWLVDVDWMHFEVGLKWAAGFMLRFSLDLLRSKSVEKLTNFPPAGLEPMPQATVALTAQYLNVR